MKDLSTYINEKLIITNKKITIPCNKQELIRAILKHFKLHNGDLNDIDVSDLNKEDLYRLFHDLKDEIKKNNITEIDISNWKLKELYWDSRDYKSRRSMFERCDTLKTIILPDCLEVISQYTFFNCKNLDNIIIPDSVTKIGHGAFSDCSELRSIIIPDLVTNISIRTFDNCSRLESVVIPNSITAIGGCAFNNCPNLIITVPNKRVKKLVKNSGFKGEIIIK